MTENDYTSKSKLLWLFPNIYNRGFLSFVSLRHLWQTRRHIISGATYYHTGICVINIKQKR